MSLGNMHGLVRGLIQTINPDETVTLKTSTGYDTLGDGTQVPQYSTQSYPGSQIQALSGDDLKQIANLNLQGTLRKGYFYGDVQAIVRAAGRGGDVIIRADSSVWLVTHVLETWANGAWCAVVLTLQNGA